MKILNTLLGLVLVLIALNTNAQLTIMHDHDHDHDIIHEAEKKAINLVNAVDLAQKVLADVKIPAKFSDVRYQKALRIYVESRITIKRNHILKKLIDGSVSYSAAELHVNRFKKKLIAKINNFQEADYEKLIQTFGTKETVNNPPLRIPGGPCINPDFEMCDFTDWTLVTGTVPYPSSAPFSFTSSGSTTSYSVTSTPTPMIGTGSAYDQHYIVTGGTDGIGGFPMVYPGGSCSAAIGDFTNTGNGAAQITKVFNVSSGDAILTLNYAVCLESAGHIPAEQPYFRARVYDAFGNSIACAEYEAYAGDGQPGWVTSGLWFYKPWTTVFIPLAPYLGQDVTVEFTVGDCAQGGHAGYAYVDASCSAMALNMSASSVCAGSPITISAPPGAASYSWNTGATTQTITVSTAGTYSVTVIPVTGSACGITLDTTITAYPNPIAAFTDDAPQCTGVPINFTDNSNPSGSTITSWAWNFGDGATSALQNPTHPYTTAGTYNVTLTVTTSDGCTNTITQTVTITSGGTPAITPAGPFCVAEPPTILTASIGGGTWSATCGGCINATTGSFDPAAAGVGTHTITYTLAGSCSGSDTETIIVNAGSDATITPGGPYCNTAAPVTLTAAMPGGTWSASCGSCINSTTGVFDPSIATIGNNTVTYTIGGACPANDNEVFVVNFAPDPSITPAGPFCSDGAAVILTAASGGGTWSASCGGCINATTGSFNPALASVGANTVTYTIPGSCPNNDTETITIEEITITSITTTDVICFGNNDGTITITSPGAAQYSIDNGITFQVSNVFTGLGPNIYTIVVENALGCQATGTATVNEPPQLTAIPGFQDESCFGACDGFVVVAPGGGVSPYSFTWTGPGGVSSTAAVFNSLCVGTYNITVTDDNGCTVTATTAVGGPTQVVITSIATTPEFCPGDCQGTITITASGGTGVYEYSNNGGGSFQVGNNFVNICTGTYNMVVEDNAGCQATGTASIAPLNPLVVNPSASDTVCIGQTATVSATSSGGTAPINFNWDNGLGAGASHVVDPTGTTLYTVTATDDNGCAVSATVLVVEHPPLFVTAFSDQTICPGETAAIYATGGGGNGGPYTFSWGNDQNATILSGNNQNVTPNTLTQFTVTMTDNCGTPAVMDAVSIGLHPLPPVTFVPDNLQGCSPVGVNFVNTTNAALSAFCDWDFGDGSTSNSCTPSHVFTEPGCYDISLTVTTVNGCVVDTMINNQICVWPIPQPEFTFQPQPANVFDTDIYFTNLTLGGDTYFWDFAGLGSSTLIHPNFEFPADQGGTYPVCLTATNTYGCVASICHDVIIEGQFIIYVPNAFTVDGDGVNDIFLPVLQGEIPDTYELMVFNRWGERIFYSNDKTIGWDGQHKNIQSKEDVYVWKIRVKSSVDNERKEFIGHVSLLR